MNNNLRYQDRIKNNKAFLAYIMYLLQFSKSESETEYIWEHCLTFRYYTQQLAFWGKLENPILQQLDLYADVFFAQLDGFVTTGKAPVDKISAPSYLAELKNKIERCIEYRSAIDTLEKQRVQKVAFNN